ncbi:g-protein beta wd-40 repeats containing [Paraphaeosphaeria sporulosa]
MASTTSHPAFGDAYSSVQANNFTGSVHFDTLQGRPRAVKLLRHEDTLARLPYAKDAPFNSYAKRHDPPCLANTRIDLLNEIHERCIFWLRGLAGTGTSTIARTVPRHYSYS